ncbi:MAG: hypothetical protein JW941_00540 [Candidatus Coatesbacteria bacterium]|nr:hypothetical protein [Candidatus Coatesbacteria bacterium]
MKRLAYFLLLVLVLSFTGTSTARHFEMLDSGEGPENHFGVAISFPYENSDVRYGRILENQGYELGATWFVVSHWDTPLSWAEVQKFTNPQTGEPFFSDRDTVTFDTLKDCHDRGIKNMITLSFSNPSFYPDWLYTPDEPAGCTGSDRWCFYVQAADEPDGVTSYDDDDPDIGHIETTYISAEWLARYMKYCKTMAEYYGEYVDGWMVWEEQNWVPSGAVDADDCMCKSEFWRPYPPFATADDWQRMTKLYAEMLLNTAPLMKNLAPHAKLIFGATCGCDVPYINAVVAEMVALGATQEFFETYIDGYGFHGFRTGVWQSESELYLGAPEVEVPYPHQYIASDDHYGRCSMFIHYDGRGAPQRSFVEHVNDLRSGISAVTGQDPGSIALYNTEDGSPFHYSWPCKDQLRGFVRMAKYLARSHLTCFYADVHVAHWQMQEGDAGDDGADYGLINRTHTNSGCSLTPDRPYILPELRRQAYYGFQLIASLYNKTLSYVNPLEIGTQIFDMDPIVMALPLPYQPRPERSSVSGGNEEIALMIHVPTSDPSRESEILISDWKMTDFPLAVGSGYGSRRGLTYVVSGGIMNPNTMTAWLKVDLSASELLYDTTVPPEIWEVSSFATGDMHILEVECPEKPLSYRIDPENPSTIIIEEATISDYVNTIEISPAKYPSFKAAGTMDSYLTSNPDGSLSGNLSVVALPYGHTFIDSIKVFYRDFDLGVSMADLGNGLFVGQLTAPGSEPGAANSLIADGASHPIIFAAGISQNAMFAGEKGSFVVRAYAFDADHSSDAAAIASCQVRIPGTTFSYQMERSIAEPGSIDSFEWSVKVEFEDLSGIGAGLYPIEVVATDQEDLQSVPWPNIPTGDGTYIDGLYLNLHVKGRSGEFENCWPELRLN